MSQPIDSGGSEPGSAPLARPSPPSLGRLLAFAGVAGLLAGLVAWGVGELTLPVFLPKSTQIPTGSPIPRLSLYEHAEADFKNAVIAYTLLGTILGLELGLAAGLARRAMPDAIRAGAVGALLGALLAAGAAALVLPVYFREEELNPEQLSHDLLLPLLVHAGCWAAAGLAGGLAWGLGLKSRDHPGRSRLVRAGMGGTLGAIAGAIVYELIAGFGFPGDSSGEPVSRTMATRLIARVAVAGLAGLAAAALAESPPRRVVPAAA